jgi:hypothetical protein
MHWSIVQSDAEETQFKPHLIGAVTGHPFKVFIHWERSLLQKVSLKSFLHRYKPYSSHRLESLP